MNLLLATRPLDPATETVLLSGTQALVRLLLLQAERDRHDGLKTAGYVSGYRGSPLGGLDMELWRAAETLRRAAVRFDPGINEDLAATAVWGTQQLAMFPPATVEGVFALWYGKGPGVDRSGDPFKHGNHAGAAAKGGVLLAFGDDHAGKSSTVSHQSEQALAAHSIPVLSPASVGDIIRFGLLGWALSRYSRLWVGMKLVNETAETLASVTLPAADMPILLPDHGITAEHLDARPEFAPLQDEITLQRLRLPLAWRFADANGLDQCVLGSSDAPFGIVTHGKAYADVRQALTLLGIDAPRAAVLGIKLLKIGMIWPLSPEPLYAFARNAHELLFIEEKKAFIELQAAHLLYNRPHRPTLTGKRNSLGQPLLPSDEPLDPLTLALVIAARINALGQGDAALLLRVTELEQRRDAAGTISAAPVARTPYFCSGCPHSSSTIVPQGSVALSGIGCHGMAMWMKRDTVKSVHMGGEGANWIGAAPFTKRDHIFQNLGDGTYSHSGLLAIRAAVQADVNITYKILYNSAVAMTGGQPVEGGITVGQIARQVLAQDVAACVIVTDDVERLPAREILPDGIVLHPRSELDTVQRALAKTSGVTVLIYDQQCATEARRLRKRGLQIMPARRAFIHPDICEGCGDCSVQSNCVSLIPLETSFGIRRAIDQNSCNQDLSCVQGFCPSFVTVEGATLQHAGISDALAMQLGNLPEMSPLPLEGRFSILIAGIGGTGVVTVSQLLVTAGHAAGLAATSFNMTGLAQKGGAVWSHVRLSGADDLAETSAARLGIGEADLVIGCDLVVAAAKDTRNALKPGSGRMLYNSHAAATAEFQTNRDHRIDPAALVDLVEASCMSATGLSATQLVERLLGDPLGVNAFLLGAAHQKGFLPLELRVIRDAIRRNGAAVTLNLTALDLGRLAVHAPDILAGFTGADGTAVPRTLPEVMAHRRAHLTRYQNAAYAQRYDRLVAEVEAAEREAVPGQHELTLAVAKNLAKLMAYKDEYEVARLFTDPGFRDMVTRRFGSRARIRFHLAPPVLGATGSGGTRPAKRSFGAWMHIVFALLARMKGLRGTVFDPFGYLHERREERQLCADFEHMLREDILPRLAASNHALALEAVRIPEDIRGFGSVKQIAIAKARARWAEILEDLRGGAEGPRDTLC